MKGAYFLQQSVSELSAVGGILKKLRETILWQLLFKELGCGCTRSLQIQLNGIYKVTLIDST